MGRSKRTWIYQLLSLFVVPHLSTVSDEGEAYLNTWHDADPLEGIHE